MSDPREVIQANDFDSVPHRRNSTNVTSPRSPVKLEDYANIRRPSTHEPLLYDTQGANTNPTNNDGKSPFQRELESALKERKKRGLATGLSDSETSTIGGEVDNNNVVHPGYLSKPDHGDHSDQWQNTNNDSIPFNNSDLSFDQSNREFDHHDPHCVRNQSSDPSLSQRSSLFEFEQLETVMNQHSQSSTGLGNVIEETAAEGSRNVSGRLNTWSGPDGTGDILHLEGDMDGSGLMSEDELRDQGVLFEESSGNEDQEEVAGYHGDLPQSDSTQMLQMYMEPSPRPPGYPDDDYEEDVVISEEEDYVNALENASVDDVVGAIANSDISNDEGDSRLEYSDEFDDRPDHHGDAASLENGDSHDFNNENGYVDDKRRSGTPGMSEEGSEAASPELGATVIRNDSINAAILAAAAKVESFVDEPEGGESDATSVSLGQFVPNAVQRTRLPPPGQRRSSVKGLKNSNLAETAEKPSPRTTPRRSKSNSPRSVCSNVSRRSSVRSNAQSETSARSQRSSVRSNAPSEVSARETSLTEEYLAALNQSDHSDVHTELPTLMSMYLGNDPRFKSYQRPDGVPPLDFGNSINSNISFLPRDDDRARSQAEEFAEQLQKDYDDLLAKYAQAENTIDQLRLGAKVNLYGDDPVPGQAVHGSLNSAKQAGVIQFGQAQNATVEHVLTINTNRSSGGANQLAMGPQSALSTVREGGSHHGNDMKPPGEDADDLVFPQEASAGGKAMVLMFQANDLQGQVDAFDTLLKQDQVPPSEQKTTYDSLKGAQDQLESDYMQAKEEDNALRRRNSIFNTAEEEAAFDPERAVEGQIFQIGMKLDDIHETVTENLRNQPVDIPRTPSIQEMIPPAVEEHQRDHHDQLSAAEPHNPSKIPVLKGNADRFSEIGVDAESIGNKEEESSPSPPFSPSGSSTPGIASPYNGDFDDNKNQAYNDNDRHYQEPSVTSSSPEFTHKETKPNHKGQHKRPTPRNQHHQGNPRSRLHQGSPRTGSSDHLDNGGARHQKSPEPADFDSGFMGSESSRQSNQIRPFGYKRSSGIGLERTKAKETKRASQLPQVQRTQKGQRPGSYHGSTAASRESPLHSEGVVSESEEETMIQVPARKQNERTSNSGRANSIPNHSIETQEPKSKHTVQKTKHSPPHQSLPPSKRNQHPVQKPKHSPPHQSLPPSKRNQRQQNQHTRSSLPTRDTHAHTRKEPPAHPLPHEPHHHQQNAYQNEHIEEKSTPSSATKPYPIRPSSSTTRSSRYQKYPHRTNPSAMMYESGSEVGSEVTRSGSEVTRSSAKSDAMRALQDEIDELRRQMQEKNEPPKVQRRYPTDVSSRTPVKDGVSSYGVDDRIPIRHDADNGRPLARTPTRHDADNGRPSGRRGSTAGSTKSEALQALRLELEDIKGQLRQKNNTPRSDFRPSSDQRTRSAQHFTPLRDSLRETLRSQFIPQPSPVADVYSKSSLPHRTHSTPYRTPHRTELPPKLHVSDLDASPVRGGSPYSRTGGDPYRESCPEPCPLCGGSGSHTHSQYQSGSPPSQPTPMQPPQPAMQPMPSQPTPMQQPPQPVMHSYPQSLPTPQGYSYAPMTTSTPSMQPMPSQSYVAAPLVTPISYQQTPPQSVPGNGMHHFQSGGVPVNGMYQSQPAGGEPQHQVTTNAHPQPATHIRDDATPAVVYVTPARRKGRYYSRDDESSSSSREDEQVELYYRRTPRGSTVRSPRSSRYGGSILQKTLHKEVSFDDDDDGMDKSLDSALSMARRLKKSSNRMLSSVRRDMNRSASLRESGFY